MTRVTRLTLLACAVAALLGAGQASAATLKVCQSACPYAQLAPAVAAAQSGDKIKIGPGTYAGGVTIDVSVKLVGAGANRTIISGGGPVVTIGEFGASSEPTVSIDGVTITGGVTRSSPESHQHVAEPPDDEQPQEQRKRQQEPEQVGDRQPLAGHRVKAGHTPPSGRRRRVVETLGWATTSYSSTSSRATGARRLCRRWSPLLPTSAGCSRDVNHGCTSPARSLASWTGKVRCQARCRWHVACSSRCRLCKVALQRLAGESRLPRAVDALIPP
jgi:hypothetical protein